jgi:hypothetical protein
MDFTNYSLEFTREIISRAMKIPGVEVSILHDCVEFTAPADKIQEIENLPYTILSEHPIRLTADFQTNLRWK